ncbi:MAG: hypothetical protein HYZ11_01925 [Candidatus Tectomicrobia bacterium]|uniref:Metalloenzyme domain-containing protein n=1 Tax=Tectimicrobiota bacterium TaxID=2528274 RepID=A0A932HVM8_UNCTE|nr:hypothetical protein [Candidatus Tectomicrobia bacterium]
MRQPILLLVLGGAADRACPSLGGRTPLLYARTPNLDEFAHHAQCGVAEVLGPGAAPSADLAHLAFLGYGAREHHPGRAFLEALGEGLDPLPDEVVLRARLALVQVRRMRLVTFDRAPVLPEEDARRMAEAAARWEDEAFRVRLVPTGGGEGLLFLRTAEGEAASPHLRDSDPFAAGRDLRRPSPEPDAPDPPAARRTAHALAEYLLWAYRALNGLDIAAVREARARGLRWALLSRGAGRWRRVPPFAGWTGLQGGILASEPALRGLGRFLGLRWIEPPARPDPADQMEAAIAAGRAGLGAGLDFVLVHAPGPERAAAEGVQAKARALEAVDQGLGVSLLHMARSGEAVVAVTADGAAPCEGEAAMLRGAEPVPFAVAGRGVVADACRLFDELHCAEGMLGRFRGEEVLPRLLAFADRGRRAGLLPPRPGERLEPPPTEPLWDAGVWEEPGPAEGSHGPESA